jgi:L-lactate dehydrogenase complex protein LldF
VITPQLIGLKKAAQLPYASSLCGACREVCPVKIDIPELLLHLRAEIKQRSEVRDQRSAAPKNSRSEQLVFKVWATVMKRPRWYELSGKLGHLFQRLVVRHNRIGKVGGLVARLAPPLAAWTSARDLRPIEAKSFRRQWRDGVRGPTAREGT